MQTLDRALILAALGALMALVLESTCDDARVRASARRRCEAEPVTVAAPADGYAFLEGRWR